MMVRNRVARKTLPKVKEQHHHGVFGDFDHVMDDMIERLEKANLPFEMECARFFRYLKQRVDSEKFGAMQETYLSDEKLNLNSDTVKYIDPTIWFVSKLALAQQIQLDKRAPVEILDIGTGPAHFPVVAEFYGHSVLGTDIPQRTTGLQKRAHLYDALGDIYNVRRAPLKIEPFVPLTPFEHRFGIVTAFLAAFNVDAEKKPWSIEAWNFFLNDLRDNVLVEGGEVFMSLTDGKLTPEVWSYLSARAVFINDVSKQIHITDLSQFGG